MTGATSRVRASAMEVGPPLVRARLVSLLLRPRTPALGLRVVVATSLIVVESLLVYLLKHVDPATVMRNRSRFDKYSGASGHSASPQCPKTGANRLDRTTQIGQTAHPDQDVLDAIEQ
jgi:hypothetical protein